MRDSCTQRLGCGRGKLVVFVQAQELEVGEQVGCEVRGQRPRLVRSYPWNGRFLIPVAFSVRTREPAPERRVGRALAQQRGVVPGEQFGLPHISRPERDPDHARHGDPPRSRGRIRVVVATVAIDSRRVV